MKPVLPVLTTAAAVIAAALIRHSAVSRVSENVILIREQAQKIALLQAEDERLSTATVPVRKTELSSENASSELMKLRDKVASLRQQTNELMKDFVACRRSIGALSFSNADWDLFERNKEGKGSFPGGPRETGKLNDARAIAAALRNYAEGHEGRFTGALDEITPYLPKPLTPDSRPWENAPLTGTNEFEVVFEGSKSEIANIPPRRIALIRERQPWLTVEGKWAKTYGYADGFADIVESDDDFRSWEMRHIVPPKRGHSADERY